MIFSVRVYYVIGWGIPPSVRGLLHYWLRYSTISQRFITLLVELLQYQSDFSDLLRCRLRLHYQSEFSDLLHYRFRYNIISQSSQIYYVIGCQSEFITLLVEVFQVYYIIGWDMKFSVRVYYVIGWGTPQSVRGLLHYWLRYSSTSQGFITLLVELLQYQSDFSDLLRYRLR